MVYVWVCVIYVWVCEGTCVIELVVKITSGLYLTCASSNGANQDRRDYHENAAKGRKEGQNLGFLCSLTCQNTLKVHLPRNASTYL